ncbi:polyphosphate kinase 2 [Candidatus Tenderia electrophaga]|jgi:polyphosphate:AMP phosphotransferase|uniref:Polyphosphate kinase 2 n=1 Tax=Candidatus Tenderia electrophaga TaxID=1748243 RepID=A0A0S2TCF9_9GAMM|nr:polyphosphate kinase 2 [Candidatus Tenderia electrophaga]
MFEAVELGQSLSKAEFKQAETTFRAELLQLQRQLAEAKVAALIVIAGVEGAGKGAVVNRLNKWLDNRDMATHAFWDETAAETQRPEYWRYWMGLPARGAIGIMFGAWYWDPIYRHCRGQASDAELDDGGQRIKELEHMLHQDGMLIIKLWFHLSKKTFHQRIKQRSEAAKHVRAEKGDEHGGVDYKPFVLSAARLISRTDTRVCPWNLIEAEDDYFRDISVAQAIRAGLTQRLAEHRVADRRLAVPNPLVGVDASGASILDTLDMGTALAKSDYKAQLKHYQKQLSELAWQAYDAGMSTVIVFEGWDAAGKGGAIRRLTSAVDARLYRSHSVAAPSDEELAHHYLWRFWRQVPRAGYMTLYDRSWYGRVLVERVEQLARTDEWQRAYQEINDFEEQLVDSGAAVLKFWLHVTPEEQLKRFEQRQQTPWKQYKLTDDDWRNRDKRDAYEAAVNEMVLRTSTGKAPWCLIPADDKYYARINVLKEVCERLDQALHTN